VLKDDVSEEEYTDLVCYDEMYLKCLFNFFFYKILMGVKVFGLVVCYSLVWLAQEASLLLSVHQYHLPRFHVPCCSVLAFLTFRTEAKSKLWPVSMA